MAKVPNTSEASGPPVDPTGPAAAAPEMVPAVWHPGDVILDLYEVKQVHTGGGMGLVYRVHHRGWGIDLAVKSPRPQYYRNPIASANFEREARTWVELGLHPHTVSCYYVRRLGGVPRIFAEYVEGGTLAEWIHGGRLYEGGPRQAGERILDLAIQMAWGLAHAHAHDLVHQDVKPANVLLTSAGIAKVTDFGLARARGGSGEPASSKQKQSRLMSVGGMTPAYCSPEQAERRPLARQTDLWSWGVTVLEMFVADVTWSAGPIAAAALEHYLALEPEESRLPPMSAPLADLLRECFRHDPAARPSDMLSVVARLQAIYRQVTGSRYPRRAPKTTEAEAGTLNNRAVSLLDLGRQEEADDLWQQALALDPQHLEATYNRELLRCRGGRQSHEALLQKLRAIARARAAEWLPAYLLARCCLEGGDCLAAIQTLGRITGADAERAEVREALALAKNRLSTTQECTRTFTGHTGSVHAVGFRADGRWALSGSEDGTARLWDVATGRCLRTLRGHREDVLAVCLSPDGRLALSAGVDGAIKTWDVAGSRVLRAFGKKGDSPPEERGQSPFFPTFGKKGDCPPEERGQSPFFPNALGTLEGHTGPIHALSTSAEGLFVLSGGADGTLRLWEGLTGKCLHTFTGHAGPVRSVALSADGRLALSGGDDRTVRLWEGANGRPVRVFEGHTAWVASVCLSRDGRQALSGGADSTLRWWDVTTGECLRTITGHGGIVRSVSFRPRWPQALTASIDQTLRLWDLSGGRCLMILEGHSNWVQAACVHPNGWYALSGSTDRTLKLWRLDWELRAPLAVCRVRSSEHQLAAMTVYERRLAQARRALIEGDSLMAVRCLRSARAQPGYETNPDVLRSWRQLYGKLERAALRSAWEGMTLTGHKDAVTSVSVSGDGKWILSGSRDRSLRVWNVRDGSCRLVLKGHESGITGACLDLHGTRALSSSLDRTVRVWDLSSGDCLAVLAHHEAAVHALAWTPAGDFALSGGDDQTLKLWDVARRRCVRTLSGHAARVGTVALSPDGCLAVSGSEDESLRLWDVARGECLLKVASHGAPVTSIAFGGTGRQVLTGHSSFDGLGRIKLWSVAHGRGLRTFERSLPSVRAVALSLDGRFALSGDSEPTVKIWSVADGHCLHPLEGHAPGVNAVCFSRDGRLAVSGGNDGTVRTWLLDWELENNKPAAWDAGARPYLEAFLTRHTPRDPRRFKLWNPLASRPGPPAWTEEDFAELLDTLGCAGYGWLTAEGVRKKLRELAGKRERGSP